MCRWESRLLVEPDHGRVLPAPPPLRHLRDDRAVRRHEARVARVDLVRKRRVGLEEVQLTPASRRRRPSRRAGAARALGRRRLRSRASPSRSSSSAASGSCPACREGRRGGRRTRSRRPTRSGLERDQRRRRDRLGRKVVGLVDVGEAADLAEAINAKGDDTRAETASEEGERVRGAVDHSDDGQVAQGEARRAARGARDLAWPRGPEDG